MTRVRAPATGSKNRSMRLSCSKLSGPAGSSRFKVVSTTQRKAMMMNPVNNPAKIPKSANCGAASRLDSEERKVRIRSLRLRWVRWCLSRSFIVLSLSYLVRPQSVADRGPDNESLLRAVLGGDGIKFGARSLI